MPEPHLDNPDRAWQWLQRARELTGSSEGDRMVSAVWREWFRGQNDDERASIEDAYMQNAFDLSTATSTLDYDFYAFLTFAIASFLLLVSIVINGRRRARLAHPRVLNPIASAVLPTFAAAAVMYGLLADTPSSWEEGLLFGGVAFWILLAAQVLRNHGRHSTWSLPRNATLWSLVVGAAGFLFGAVDAYGDRADENPFIILVVMLSFALLFVLAIFFTRAKVSLLDVAGAITPGERRAALILSLLAALASFSFLLHIADGDRLQEMPIGIADSFGHPVWVEFLDRALERAPNTDLRRATAVAHHLQGDFEGARKLYRELPQNDEVGAALAAIDEKRIEVVMPSGSELVGALTDLPLRERFRSTGESLMLGVELVGFPAAGMLVLSLVLLVVRPLRDTPDAPAGRVLKWAGTFVPSLWWLRTGRTLFGAVSLVFFVFLIIVAIILPNTVHWSEEDDFPSPGLFSLRATPQYLNAPFPLPGDLTRKDIPDLYRSTIFFSRPGAAPFAVIVVISLMALMTLHGLTVRDIRRQTPTESIHDARTAITPSPEDVATTPTPVDQSDATEIKPR